MTFTCAGEDGSGDSLVHGNTRQEGQCKAVRSLLGDSLNVHSCKDLKWLPMIAGLVLIWSVRPEQGSSNNHLAALLRLSHYLEGKLFLSEAWEPELCISILRPRNLSCRVLCREMQDRRACRITQIHMLNREGRLSFCSGCCDASCIRGSCSPYARTRRP